MSWKCGDKKIRDLWALDPQIAFLNHGSYGAVPLMVSNYRQSILDRIEKNPADFLGRRLPAHLDEQRNVLADFLHADPKGVAFVRNATSGAGAVLSSLSWSPGDEIVFHNHGYGWVRQGLQNLMMTKGVVVKEAQLDWPNAKDEETVNQFIKMFSRRTKLVVCDHVSSPTALTFPVAKIVAAARHEGIPVLVDGAHAPGFLPLDLGTLDADFYTGNLHKWVCAPRGAAFLYVSERFRSTVRPESLSYSGGVTHHHYDSNFSGYFDWTGTSDFTSWLSIKAALEFNAQLGWEQLFMNRRKLLIEAKNLFLAQLKLDPRQLVADESLCAMLTVPWPLRTDVEPSLVLARELSRELFEKNGVEVPVIFFGNRLHFRISAQAYNRLNDYERLSDAVKAHRYSAVAQG